MLVSIIKSFNWIDILVIILIIRIVYVAVSQGLFVEIFKFLGVIFSAFICLHYYTRFADTFESLFKINAVSIELWDFLAFLILWLGVGISFRLVRQFFSNFIKLEVISIVNRWFCLFLGLGRGFIFTSLLVYLLSIPVIDYFKKSVEDSYLGRRIFFISPSIYKGVFSGFISKLMPQEKFNDAVLDIEKDLK